MKLFNRKTLSIAILSSGLMAGGAIAGGADHNAGDNDFTTDVTMIDRYDDPEKHGATATAAWLDGKLETAFAVSENLRDYRINSYVKGDTAYLSGEVETELQKDYAGEIAENIVGIHNVENRIQVTDRPAAAHADDTSFADFYNEAETLTLVKSKLLMNDRVSGLSIDVDVEDGTVWLKGMVDSEAEAELAENIATETAGVTKVVNNLRIAS